MATGDHCEGNPTPTALGSHSDERAWDWPGLAHFFPWARGREGIRGALLSVVKEFPEGILG